jgi:nucleotide-binding universal stress UspA family protein
MSLSANAIHPTAATPDEAVEPRTVVVGYDGSDEARAAFAVAIDRAHPSDRIVLVHATAPASNWLGTPYYDRAVAQSHEAAQRVLDEMRPIAEQVETPIEFSVLEGPPAEVLIRAAAAREADEIVVGSRGLGRIRGALGSVSQELLREAARPVLVVNRDAATVRGAPALAS